jgi:peptide/nickel transport system substrate-binding protein
MRHKMLAALILGLVALPWASHTSRAGKADDTLNIVWTLSLPSYDQYFGIQREAYIIGRLIWDMLIDRDPITQEYKGLLATKWEWKNDTTLDLDLRQGVKFHNGADFDAQDVVYTLNWVADPAHNVRPQIFVEWIKNVEALDKYKVRINMKYPFPAAIEYLSSGLAIYPHAYYAEVGPKGMSAKPIGTGPYKAVDVVPGQSITLVKNPDYFKDSPKGQPKIGKIVQRTIPEVQTQVAELLSGRADWVWRVPADLAGRLASRPNIKMTPGETMRVSWVAFNIIGAPTPVHDVRVRRAIAYAINRKAISEHLVPGSRVINGACFPEQFGCTQDVVNYEYSPAKAKQLLAEAGVPNGFKIDLYAYRDRQITETIIGDLRAVGIEANLVYMDYPALYTKMIAGEVPMVNQSTGSFSINDWSVTGNIFFNGSPQDTTRDPEVMAWVIEAGKITDPERRKALYANAMKKIADQAYYIMLTTDVTNYAYTADLNFNSFADETARFYLSSWK